MEIAISQATQLTLTVVAPSKAAIQKDSQSMRSTLTLLITLAFGLSTFLQTTNSHSADVRGLPSGALPPSVKGTFAYIDPSLSKLFEVDASGKVIWDYEIPKLGGDLAAGADIEWIASTNSFLFVVPGSGVYEVRKKDKNLIWSCKTPFISHDADRLPNGDTIFINAWDSDDAPIVTLVDSNCREKRTLFAKDLGLDPQKRRPASGESYSNTHINAIQVMSDDAWLISLRNYGQFILLSPDSKAIKKWGKTKKGHDPNLNQDGSIYFAQHGKEQALIHIRPNGSREVIFSPEEKKWTPLRTVQPIDNKYFLMTGSEVMGVVDTSGTVLWSLTIHGFQAQKGGRGNASFLYKAVFIPSKD